MERPFQPALPDLFKDIRLVYPNCGGKEGDGFHPPTDYRPAVESFGYEIIHEQHGDNLSLYLLQSGSRFGMLTIDNVIAPQDVSMCCDYEDLAGWRAELQDRIYWRPDAEAMRRYLAATPWQTRYGIAWAEARPFILKAKHIMRSK